MSRAEKLSMGELPTGQPAGGVRGLSPDIPNLTTCTFYAFLHKLLFAPQLTRFFALASLGRFAWQVGPRQYVHVQRHHRIECWG